MRTFIDENNNMTKANNYRSKSSRSGTGRASTRGESPRGLPHHPLYIENKSKRLQLLTKPSTAEKLKAKAQREGRSVNDIVNTILEEALKGE